MRRLLTVIATALLAVAASCSVPQYAFAQFNASTPAGLSSLK